MAYYRSQIAAAIGGQPLQVRQLVEQLKGIELPGAVEIFDKFQFITIEKDFAVYAMHLNSVPWCEKAQAIWQTFCSIALKYDLSYVFYRIGEEYNDIEVQNSYGKRRLLVNKNQSLFEKRLFDLFIFSREILTDHPKLAVLNVD